MIKKNILVLCGGTSPEHEISLLSAASIIAVLEQLNYKIILVGISSEGNWYYIKKWQIITQITHIDLLNDKKISFLTPRDDFVHLQISTNLSLKIDIVFPILHGPGGEDGTIQGLCEAWNLPYVGSPLKASLIGMNKYLFKLLLTSLQLPVVPFICINEKTKYSYFDCSKKLNSSILFIKPVDMGSSLGVSKVKNEREFIEAITIASQFSDQILVEQYIKGKELECCVLGYKQLDSTGIGEIKVNADFYSYEAKYLNSAAATTIIPAILENNISKQIQCLAKKIFQFIGARGVARIDFFLSEDNKIFINEVNTMPGFTKISMCPKLWEARGVSYAELLEKLIKIGFDAHNDKQQYKSAANKLCLEKT